MSDMSEELQKRLDQKPDIHTLAWWNSQLQEIKKVYSGACHATNCVLAENEDARKLLKELTERVAAIEADRAKIGELQARVERMAEFLTKLKQGYKP